MKRFLYFDEPSSVIRTIEVVFMRFISELLENNVFN